MIRCTMYIDGVLREDLPVADISDVIPVSDNQVWLDLEGGDVEHIELLREEFGFHELALEDSIKAGQRSKLDEYPGYYFLVFYAPHWDAETQRVQARAVHCFVGPNYLVTVHREPIVALQTARQRWKQKLGLLQQGIGYLVYVLMDCVIDEYFPLLEQFNGTIEHIEEHVFESPTSAVLDQIFTLKKDLLYLRKILSPKRDIFNILSRRDQTLFANQTQPYLRDVYDHLLRLLEQIDLQREMSASLLDVYISATSNRLNAIMKTLTVTATVLMTWSFIAGLYGMNFEWMPELHWKWGYPAALGLMLLSGAGMIQYFRKKKWF